MEKMVLLDGYSLMYRAYHALQTPMSAPDGTPTNAVHGFVMMLLKVIGEERPDGLAVAFDMRAPTFRKELFDGYKATRKPMPDDLRAQDPIIRELIARMEIPILECPEAADEISANDEVNVDFDTGVITDITTGKSYKAQPFPEFIQNIIRCGGLLASLKAGESND